MSSPVTRTPASAAYAGGHGGRLGPLAGLGVRRPGGELEPGAGHLDLLEHLDQAMAHGLVRGDRLVEDHPFRRVRDGVGERPVGRADGLGRQGDRDVVLDALPRPAWFPGGPSGTTGASSSTRRASLRVGSSEGTGSARAPAARPGDSNSSRYERTPSSLRATTMAQSAVCPSTTAGFSPRSTHWAPLRRARVRTVPRGSPCPCSPRATVARRGPGGEVAEELGGAERPGGQRGGHGGGEERPRQRDPPHLLEHDARLEQARRRCRRARRAPAVRSSRGRRGWSTTRG